MIYTEKVKSNEKCWMCGKERFVFIKLSVCKFHFLCYLKFLKRFKGNETSFIMEYSE